MRYSVVLLFLFSAAIGFAGLIATVSTTTSGSAQSAQNTGEFSVALALDGGSAGGSYDGGNLFHLAASASKDVGPGRVLSTASYMFELLVIGTNQPGFLLMSPSDNAPLVLIGPTRLQNYSGNVQGAAFEGGSSSHPPGSIYVPFQPGVPVSVYASLSAVAGASDVDFPGDISADLAVFVSGIVRSEMREDAVIQGASWVVVPEPGTSAFVLVGLGLIGGLGRQGRGLV